MLKNLGVCVAAGHNIATLCVALGLEGCRSVIFDWKNAKRGIFSTWRIMEIIIENGQTTSKFSSMPDMNINCTSNFLFPVIIDVVGGAGEDVIPLITSARGFVREMRVAKVENGRR